MVLIDYPARELSEWNEFSQQPSEVLLSFKCHRALNKLRLFFLKLHFILSYHLIFTIIKNEVDYIMTPLKFERLQHFINTHDSYS